MKWKGREGSGNVEDRRGMSTGRMAVVETPRLGVSTLFGISLIKNIV